MRVAAVILAVAWASVSTAAADAKQDQAAVAKLAATYQPVSNRAGADRVNQACADAGTLIAVFKGVSHTRTPAGSAVDDLTWGQVARGLAGALSNLDRICKAPDRKIKLISSVQTADEVVGHVDEAIRKVIEAAKPRAVSPAVAKFKTTLARTRFPSRSLCTQQSALAKQLPALEAVPARATAATWQKMFATVKGSLAGLQASACGKQRGADEEIASVLVELHDHFYELVLLVPPI